MKRLLIATDGNMYVDSLTRAVICLLLDIGMRAHELCSLKLTDTHVVPARVKLSLGKGGKTSMLGFGTATRQALDAYLQSCAQLPERHDDTLLLNSHGKRITERNLDRLLKSYSRRAGIAPVSAHMFRVTFAVEQFLNGASLRAVQTALRHSSVDMAVHYMRLAEQERVALSCAMTSVIDGLEVTQTTDTIEKVPTAGSISS